jgi:5-methylcytosine-specific restriction endonuclease McrA
VSDLTCDHCAAPFVASRPNKRFCSELCRKRHEWERAKGRRVPRPRKPAKVYAACQDCRGPIPEWPAGYANSTSARSRCRACYNAYCKRRYAAKRGDLYKKPPAPKPEPQPARTIICARCGKEKITYQPHAIYCSRYCNREAWLDRGNRPEPKVKPAPKPKASPLLVIHCGICARPMVSRRGSKYCSEQCRINNVNNRVTALYFAATRRADVKGGMFWRRRLIDYLVNRDGTHCGICHHHVDITLTSGPRGDDAGPSIDHVVPRSKGGSDDLTNLRLTHWSCNRQRGNRGDIEQLRLVG